MHVLLKTGVGSFRLSCQASKPELANRFFKFHRLFLEVGRNHIQRLLSRHQLIRKPVDLLDFRPRFFLFGPESLKRLSISFIKDGKFETAL